MIAIGKPKSDLRIAGTGINLGLRLLLLKRPKVSAKNLKLGQAAAAAISAAEPQSTGDNSRVVEAIRRLNSRAEMKRLSELLADLNRNVGIILTNNPTEARSSVLNSAEMMAPKIFDSLMRKKSLSYRISVLKRWINQIVLNELPQTMVNSHVEEMINIQYAVTEIRRAIDELSILDEISEGGSSNDGLRMQPNSMASELSRDSDQLANSPLIQASIIIPPSWALRTMINDEGAALDAFGDMRTLSREMDLADARTALVSLTREAVTNSMAPVEQIIVPESLFEVELAQLSEMGFHDTRTNIQALQLANGVVEEAVELLFEYFMRNAN